MLLGILKQYQSKMILATTLSAASAIVSIALLDFITSKLNSFNKDTLLDSFPWFLTMILFLLLISYVSQFIIAKLGSSLIYDLRLALLQKAVGLDYEKIERIGGHKILATMTNDVNNIAMSLMILPLFAVNLATIVFCLIYLAIESISLFGFLLLGLVSGVAISYAVLKKGQLYFTKLREKEDELFNVFKTLIDGSKELNINEKRKSFFHSMQAIPVAEDAKNIELKAKSFWVLSDSISRPLLFMVLGFVLFAGQYLLSIELSVLTRFILFTTFIVGPITTVQGSIQALIKGKIAYRKIQSLELSDAIPQSNTLSPAAKRWGEITFDNVSYAYDSIGQYRFQLGPIDMQITEGDNIFICGGNGSGKSTFAKLLVGLYHPHEGAISLAGNIISSTNHSWFRSHFATIFSDFYLFDYVLDKQGKPATSAEIIPHLHNLKLSDKVDIVDGRISSTKLSQGQKKRLAMLIALCEDAEIYLFDEWAADQDPEFREYFYRSILPELKGKGKTLIVITHDDKYYHLADKLIKFENGQIQHIQEYNNSSTPIQRQVLAEKV